MSSTPVEPFVVTTTMTVVSFSITCRTLILFNNASFVVDSFDINGNLVSRQIVSINEEQYSQWNNDDNYIVNLIAGILGYILVNPVVSSQTDVKNTQTAPEGIIFNGTVNGP
jgi:hypothetical protein